jgi:hypothetical protein
VAGSQSKTVIKANSEGGGSVNTLTGSVSVAGSQSNTVLKDNSEDILSSVEIDARRMKTDEGERVKRDEASSGVCGVTDMVCVQAVSSQTGASKIENPAVPEARKVMKAKFQLTNIKGGTFSLKINSKKRGSVKEGVSDEQNLNISNFSKFTNISNLQDGVPARNTVHGENQQFNNIEIIKTPQKRKLVYDSTVAKLVCRFSGDTSNLPGASEDNNTESPAKRRRVWGQRGQGH